MSSRPAAGQGSPGRGSSDHRVTAGPWGSAPGARAAQDRPSDSDKTGQEGDQEAAAGLGPAAGELDTGATPGHTGAELADDARDTLDDARDTPGDSADSALEQAGQPGQQGSEVTGSGLPGAELGPGTGEPVLEQAGPGGGLAPVTRDDGRHPWQRYDWPAVKKMYVQGVNDTEGENTTKWLSLDAVAAHFGIPPQRVREKSAMDGWVGERKRWQAQIETTQKQARAAALAKDGLKVDNAALEAAKMGLQLALHELQAAGKRAQRARTENVGDPDAAHTGLDPAVQLRLAQTVDLWHKIGLRAVGDPELHRVELSGPNGAPIEITQELRRDDPQRIATVLAVLEKAGLADIFGGSRDPRSAIVRDAAADGDDGPLELGGGAGPEVPAG